MSLENEKYGAIVVDTSVFIGQSLKLEKGLLGKLSQFKDGPIEYILPDVIVSELKNHLESKIKSSVAALEKALNDAGDHLFFDGSELNKARHTLVKSAEMKGLAENRIERFINSTGALVLKTGDYVSVSDLLSKYFLNEPPFSGLGKKKNEFPDAITLMAVEAWAVENKTSVLAISKDGDWKNYCDQSDRVDIQEELSHGLEIFNRVNAPYAMLSNLTAALDSGHASKFLSAIGAHLKSALDGFTPDQHAESFLIWEPNGSHGWFESFELTDHEFRIIDKGDDWLVLEIMADIEVGAEGDFTLYAYDTIDHENIYMGGVTALAKDNFESEILITISGEFNGPIDELSVDGVEIVSQIKEIHFGTIEPDVGEREDYL